MSMSDSDWRDMVVRMERDIETLQWQLAAEEAHSRRMYEIARRHQGAARELRAELARVRRAAERVNDATFSHVDGRDLLAELHPRKTLDIKRRVDGKETWYEGDWLSSLYDAVKKLRATLSQPAEQSTAQESGDA